MNKRKHKTRTQPGRSSKSRFPWPVLVVFGFFSVFAIGVVLKDPPILSSEDADVVVYKTAKCSCCRKWVDHLRDHGVNRRLIMTPDRRAKVTL